MKLLQELGAVLGGTLLDLGPILAAIFGFQYLLLRRPIPDLRRVLAGLVYVTLGLALFLEGLERALFPLGQAMAAQLTATDFLGHTAGAADWADYYWVYLFGGAVGFASALAEPALIAVALKANEESGGAIDALGLRLAAAIGVAFGVSLGMLRIVLGWPLHWFIIAGYVAVLAQTLHAPRLILPLAYDSGGVTTSTVTVPLITALGLGLAAAVPGRDPLRDGFGLIASACLCPVIAVLAYGQLAQLRASRHRRDVS